MLLAILIMSGFAFSLASPSDARVDPSTHRIRVLYVGDAWTTSTIKQTLGWINAEPRFSLQIVPADLEFMLLSEAWKYTRLYLPRTYESLNLSYDIIILHNISPNVMERGVLTLFQRGIRDDGMGIGLITFYFWGGTNDMEVWTTLPFYEVFPCDVLLDSQSFGYQGKIFIKVVKRKPILDLPGIEKVPMQGSGNHGGEISPRAGSVVHAIWQGKKTPALVTGRYGEGKTLQFNSGWHIMPMIPEEVGGYAYMPDFIYNQLYFVAGVSPPADIALAHDARDLFINAQTRKAITVSSMEFAEKFGANLQRPEKELAELEAEVRRAESSYLQGDYEAARTLLEEVLENFLAIDGEVMRLKDRALRWIYLTEWLAVVSTSMICGIVLWTLMVARKSYKEVEHTRLSFSDHGGRLSR